MPGMLFPIAIVGGLALLALSSSSSSSTKAGDKRGQPKPIDDLSPTPGPTTPAYKPTITGEDATFTPTVAQIKAAQQCLKNLGFYSDTIDGKIGPNTKKALLAFQQKFGLKTQNGELTKESSDLVCDAGSPIGDLIKGGMSKEDANRLYTQGRAAGIQAATNGQPQDPAPYYASFGATTAEQQNAFKQGFDQGFSETMSAAGGSPGAPSASDVGDAASDKVSDWLGGGVFGGAPGEGRLQVNLQDLYPQTVVFDAQGRPHLQRIG